MDVSTPTGAWARRIGLALGALLALAAVLSWRIPAEGAALGASVRFVAVPPGELTLDPPGEFLSARGLSDGEQATGRLRLRNIAGVPVRVHLRARPSSRELDRLLRVELKPADGTGAPLFAGRLGRLRRWTPPLTLARGAARDLELVVRTGPRASGAAVDVTIELRGETLGG